MTTRKNSNCRKLAPMVRETSKVKGYMALLVGGKVGIRSALYESLRAVNKNLADAKVQPLVAQVGCSHILIRLLRYWDVAGNLTKKLKDKVPSPKAIACLPESI